MEQVKLDKSRFESRVKRFVAAWTWPLDAVVLVEGKNAEDAQQYKTEAMHHWLMGIEFPETVVVLLRSGRVMFLASASKIRYLRQLEGPNVVFMERPSAPGAELDTTQIAEIARAIRGDKQDAVVGMLLKEKHIGPFANGFGQALAAAQGLKLQECREEISDLLGVKDEQEVESSKKSANAAQIMMKSVLVDKLEKAIDGDRKVKHADLCNEAENELDNKDVLQQWKSKHGIDPDSMDLVYLSLQSGGPFELKPAVEPLETIVPMHGTYLLSIGMKYAEYSSCISRTLLVDPSPIQKTAYILALVVQKQVIDQLKPGAIFKDLYLAARSAVQAKQPELVERFVKNAGFVMGLEFKDPQQVISERSERKVQAGMVFCVSVGFCEGGLKPWAVWLADTVLVNANTTEVPTNGCPKDTDSVMYELDDGSQAQEPVQQQESKAPAALAAPRQVNVVKPNIPKAAAAKPPKSAKPEAAGPSKRGNREKVEEMPRSTRSAVERKPAPAPELTGKSIMTSRTRARNAQTIQDMSEAVQMEDKQRDLRDKKLIELQERYSGETARLGNDSKGKRLQDCKAYNSPDDLPGSIRPNRLQIDPNSEALLVPISGAIVPFHVATIKNMAQTTVERYQYLRVNFFLPGQGKTIEDYPLVNGNRIYVKELSFRSESRDNLDTVFRNFKDVQKRMKQKELESEVKQSSTFGGEALQTLRSGYPSIRDLSMRPSIGSRGGRTQGTLESHHNGFRFSIRQGAEKLDILYSQIAHAIFEPCESGSLIVLIHFHLKEAMMVGKKKTVDIQFFTEVTAQVEDLSVKKASSAYDPDEILEEQREREMKERLNKLFHDYTNKTQAIESCRLQFDIPFKEFAFPGVPFKGVVTLCPCSRALVGLQEWPPFCLSLDEVDIVVFERAVQSLREFDMVFVKKDYDQSPVRITTIPFVHIDKIKRWLMELGTVWYSCTMNMQWPMVMKEVTKDLKAFAEMGGWDPWFPRDGDDDSDSKEDKESDFDVGSGDDDDDDDDAAEDGQNSADSDFSVEPDDDEDDDDAEEDEDGMDWDELEEHAEKSDRKRDAEARDGGRQHTSSKRARR